MMLTNKNAVIFGAGGSMGGAIAKAFANAGAKVFVTDHRLDNIKKLADEINASGGNAEAAMVDAMDEAAINSYVDKIVQQAGTIDIVFNLIATRSVQNIPLVNMKMADFLLPVNIAMQSHFLTDTAAARVMIKQGSGVILSLTATPGGVAYPGVGGFSAACCAMESLSANLAAEVGPHGVRVVNIRSAGSPDSKVFKDAIAGAPDEMKIILGKMENDTMLKTLPLMNDIANTAVFLASDMAGKITGVTVDVTCGTTAGLNYRSTNDILFK
jgi:3-oxoacyl-[acyl-carrier protein] reductase